MGFLLFSLFYSSFKCKVQMPFFIFNFIESPRYLMANNFNISNSNLGKWFWCNTRETNLSQYLLDERTMYNKIDETIMSKNITETKLAQLLSMSNKNLFCNKSQPKTSPNKVDFECQKFQLTKRLINKWNLIMPNNCNENSTNCPLILDKNSNQISCGGNLHKMNLPNQNETETISILNYHQMHFKKDPSQLINRTLYIMHPFKRLVERFLSEYGQLNVTDKGKEFRNWCQNLLNQNQWESKFISISFQCEPCFIHYPIMTELSNNCDKLSSTTRAYMKFLYPQTIFDLYKNFFLDFELFGYSIEEIFN